MKRLVLTADLAKVAESIKAEGIDATLNQMVASVFMGAINVATTEHDFSKEPLHMNDKRVGIIGTISVLDSDNFFGSNTSPTGRNKSVSNIWGELLQSGQSQARTLLNSKPAPTVVEFCRTQFTINWDNGAMGAVIYFDEDMPRVKYFNEEPLRPTDENPTYRMPEDDLSFPEEQCMLVYRPQ